MPEYLDADYRDGMHSVSYDLLDEANGTLFECVSAFRPLACLGLTCSNLVQRVRGRTRK